jgi:hypothetical protein
MLPSQAVSEQHNYHHQAQHAQHAAQGHLPDGGLFRPVHQAELR